MLSRIQSSTIRFIESGIGSSKSFTIPDEPNHLFLLTNLDIHYTATATVGVRNLAFQEDILQENNNSTATDEYIFDLDINESTTHHISARLNNPHLLTSRNIGSVIYWKQRLPYRLYSTRDILTFFDVNDIDATDVLHYRLQFELVSRAIETARI